MRIYKLIVLIMTCIMSISIFAQVGTQTYHSSPRSGLLQSFIPFTLLLIIAYIIIKVIRKKNTLNKEKTKIEDKHSINNLQKSSIAPFCGSIVVIISFFLPWLGNEIGPQIMLYAPKMFKMAEYNSDFLLAGIFILLFTLSPIIIHLIIVINYLNKRFLSKALAISPLAIWLVELAILLANSNGGKNSLVDDIADFDLSIGIIGTFIGMIATIYLSLTNVIPDSSIKIIEKSNETRFCSNCGTKLQGNPLFCPECGTDLEKDS